MFQISVARLYEDHREKLGLVPAGAHPRDDATITRDADDGAALIGYLNFIHPNRIQVLGPHELAYLSALDEPLSRRLIESLSQSRTAALILCDSARAPALLSRVAADANIPVLLTAVAGTRVIDVLRRYLSKTLAEVAQRHGVCMDVLGLGVLITGDSGVGKSELGLELISRGHGLVADDVVDISRLPPTVLECRCPPVLRDFLEVRGLGVLNVRTVFGETAVRPKMNLHLVVHLEKPATGQGSPSERLPLHELSEEILGVTVRKVVIPVAAGRNLAVLLEAAVRNHILQLRGIHSTQEFIARQQSELKKSSG
jgi:HPr kinase/phosphorylase